MNRWRMFFYLLGMFAIPNDNVNNIPMTMTKRILIAEFDCVSRMVAIFMRISMAVV